MSTIKLLLGKGDVVRNINAQSKRKGWVGTVSRSSHSSLYRVEYHNGEVQEYQKSQAHRYLERLVGEYEHKQPSLEFHGNTCKVTGTPMYILEAMGNCLGVSSIRVVQEEVPTRQPKRRTLKKVRRNVISGLTQDEMVAREGHARGVQQFNTRCLGASTGQAFHAIGCAMINPGTEIRIANIDHARSQEGCSASWTTLNKHFRQIVIDLIGKRKGFTLTDTHIVFNPVVTEETYVETN